MAKPIGRCVFCGGNRLTKGHIVPEWVAEQFPPDATHHEVIVGQFDTFVPIAKGPKPSRRVRQGHAGTRKPRNTCLSCNGGWMSRIEQNAIGPISSLMKGQPLLLDLVTQWQVAAFLCLVSMRLDASVHGGMTGVRPPDRLWLKNNCYPSNDWQIWIARCIETTEPRQQHYYSGIQFSLDQSAPRGADYCNSQVTTLILGKLCAHIFSSSVYRGLKGYEGQVLTDLWPPKNLYVDTRWLPEIAEADVPWLHEALARESTHIP